jgi:hypothetical protein
MKIELTKKEPFFDNPGRGGCPLGDQAIGGCPDGDQALGLNKLVRQEQKIQAGFCGVHFKGTTRARGSLSGPGEKFGVSLAILVEPLLKNYFIKSLDIRKLCLLL